MEFISKLYKLPKPSYLLMEMSFSIGYSTLQVLLTQFLINIRHLIALRISSMLLKFILKCSLGNTQIMILNLSLIELLSYRVL